MRFATTPIVFATAAIALGAAFAPQPASAQRGNDRYDDRGQYVRCESDNDRRRTCRADTRGGVELAQQLSRSACIEGRTWGHGRDGIWVDRGCRAEFRIGGGRWPSGRPGNDQATVLRCESNNNRSRECPVGQGGRARLVRQLSSSPCVEGRTWGQHERGIWVTGGCRAEFEVQPRSWSRWR